MVAVACGQDATVRRPTFGVASPASPAGRVTVDEATHPVRRAACRHIGCRDRDRYPHRSDRGALRIARGGDDEPLPTGRTVSDFLHARPQCAACLTGSADHELSARAAAQSFEATHPAQLDQSGAHLSERWIEVSKSCRRDEAGEWSAAAEGHRDIAFVQPQRRGLHAVSHPLHHGATEPSVDCAARTLS